MVYIENFLYQPLNLKYKSFSEKKIIQFVAFGTKANQVHSNVKQGRTSFLEIGSS